ncbi:MAG: ABC transporter permease [Gemmatimonadaceae bacterium]|nr:ABC transporter permease [Gemmatimonadaceae bacterium]
MAEKLITWLKKRDGLLGVLFALGLWQLATTADVFGGVMGQSMTPVRAFQALWGMVLSGELVENAVPSLTRVLIGLGVAAMIGIPIGLLVGYNRRVERSTYVVFQFLRMISPLAWFPIVIMVFGVGEKAVIFLVVIAAIWPMIINTSHGTAQVERAWVRMARTLGANTRQLFSRVIIPAVIPDMLMGLRLALGISWVILVPAEMLGVSSGLGYYILDARDRFAYDELMAVILAIGMIGYTLDSGIRRVRAKFAWRSAEEQ